MRILFDTSVLIAVAMPFHAFHDRALPWIRMAERGEIDGIVSAHTLSEMYRVLTSIESRPRFTSSQVMNLIADRVLSTFKIVALDANDYHSALERLTLLDIRGGTIYDGLIAHAAVKGDAEQIVTFNESDFRRVTAGLPLQIVVP